MSRTPKKSITSCRCLLLTLLLSGLAASAQPYTSPPPLLEAEVERTARLIASEAPSGDLSAIRDALDQTWDSMAFLTVADALNARTPNSPLNAIPPYAYSIAASRGDKQTGSTGGNAISTSVVEKAAAPQLMAFALENGVLDQETRATNLTISSSPYAFVKARQPDTQSNYLRYGLLRRVGFSATFPLYNSQPDTLSGRAFRNLTEWSLQLRLLGERSTRSPRFLRQWQQRVKKRMENRLAAQTGAVRRLFKPNSAIENRSYACNDASVEQLSTYLTARSRISDGERTAAIAKILYERLHTDLYQPVAASEVALDSAVIEDINAELIPALQSAYQDLAEVDAEVRQLREEIMRSPVLTFRYSRHLAFDGPDFSEMKLLFSGYLDPLSVILNAGLALNHNPGRFAGLEPLRGYFAALALEGEIDNFFLNTGDNGSMSKIAFAINGRIEQVEIIGSAIATVQALLNIPVSPGFGIPFSISFSSRSLLQDESFVRGNFGLSLDMDSIFASTRSALSAR